MAGFQGSHVTAELAGANVRVLALAEKQNGNSG
jgi:nucleoside-diphosphate-sugar epimerase